MTENKGDLISREALREDLRRFFPIEVLEGIEPKALFAQIMHDIDNAPTVCGNNPKWCESCVSKGKRASTRPQGDCEKCDFRKFAETFIDAVVEVMNKYGITSLEQLFERLKGGAES